MQFTQTNLNQGDVINVSPAVEKLKELAEHWRLQEKHIRQMEAEDVKDSNISGIRRHRAIADTYAGCAEQIEKILKDLGC